MLVCLFNWIKPTETKRHKPAHTSDEKRTLIEGRNHSTKDKKEKTV